MIVPLRRLGIAFLALSVLFSACGLVLHRVTAANATSAGGPTVVTPATADQLTAAGAPVCGAGQTCVAMPCQNPGTCGIVEAGPTSDLGLGQYAYLNLYHFRAGDEIYVLYCKDAGSLSASPICLQQPIEGVVPNPLSILSIPDSGTLSVSFQVEGAPTSGTPFCGQIPALKSGQSQVPTQAPCGVTPPAGSNATSTPPGEPFFCDNGPNFCSIDVVDVGLSSPPLASPEASNAVVLPVTFHQTDAACANSTQVTTMSEFGFQQLFNLTDHLDCSANGAAATIPFNTQINGYSAVEGLDSGQLQAAFTDDPTAADQQAIIQKDNYLAIPLGISANTIGYRAQVQNASSNPVPYSNMKLTANMVAQVLDGQASDVSSVDQATCTGPSVSFTCSMYQQFNASPGLTPIDRINPFMRNDHAGTIDQLFNYLCAMPAMTLKFDLSPSLTVSATEPQTAEASLKQGIYGSNPSAAPSGCLTGDQVPPFVPVNTLWTGLSTVDLQALKLAQSVPTLASGQPATGLAPMNLAVANYYGEEFASLQNGAGSFVAPTETAVQQAITDGTWNTAGIWTPSAALQTDAAAYAMPTVMYAIVPKANLSADAISTLQAMLEPILQATMNAKTEVTPGIFPLPAAVAAMAQDEITNGIGNPTYTAALGKTSTRPGSESGSSFSTSVLVPPAVTESTTKATTPAPTPSSSPTYGPFVLTASESRMLVTSTFGLGLLFALGGVAMVGLTYFQGRRKRHQQTADLGEATETRS